MGGREGGGGGDQPAGTVSSAVVGRVARRASGGVAVSGQEEK